MGHIYIVDENGTTTEMRQYYCKNEDKDIQSLLENNPQLLAGDQINPDNHRRWLLIKREMPIEAPNTAENRWNIDFFYVDQDGIPTFVECKRFADTRSRREVVGQMLDYAANGQFYFTKEKIGDFIDEQSQKLKITDNEYVMSVDPSSCENKEEFLELIENNLREGQIRMLFFMEEAPMELKSIVDFLNKQMERSEMLIVEAKQYIKDGLKIVVPSLFGYTEQARMIKKTVTVKTTARKKWNEQSYFEKLSERTNQEIVAKQKEIFQSFSNNPQLQIRFGTGVQDGSFSIILPSVTNTSLMSCWTNGNISLNFGALGQSEKANNFRDVRFQVLTDNTDFNLTQEQLKKYISKKPDEWVNHTDIIISIIEDLSNKF